MTNGVIEKREIEIRFMPILCSAPLIYAHSQGFFEKNGLSVNLRTAPGWSGIKELLVYGKVDAVHMLAPMPLACSLGIDGKMAEIRLAVMQNVNGQALTLANKHREIRSVRDMKGFVFGVPYRYSMHYYLLCHLLAENGLDPLKDVVIKEVAPARFVYYMEKGWVDGVLAPEPFNHILVHRNIGFIYMLSNDIWPGHPCCCLATSQSFIDSCPNTYEAMLRSVLEAELALHKADIKERKKIAREISDPLHLNQNDPVPVEQALCGEFPDGRGGVHKVKDRVGFAPHPWPEYGVMMLSQMQRWKQLPGKVDYFQVANKVFQIEKTAELAQSVGFTIKDRPHIEGISPLMGEQSFSYMLKQPFSAYQEKANPLTDYDLPQSAQQRLSDILSHLTEVAGGKMDLELEITSEDEIGHLEQMLNEMVLNLKFAGEAIMEERDKLDERVKERTVSLEKEIEEHKRAKEVIERQTAEIMELSTPVIQVWKGVVIAPLIGTLDSDRTQHFMERFLEGITEAESPVALVDITGVPVVDTQTAQHLIEAITAAQLLGTRVILTGVRPAIAQTMVHLGLNLSGIETQASLAVGLKMALEMLDLRIVPAEIRR